VKTCLFKLIHYFLKFYEIQLRTFNFLRELFHSNRRQLCDFSFQVESVEVGLVMGSLLIGRRKQLTASHARERADGGTNNISRHSGVLWSLSGSIDK
jgi:hypothetical protein